MPGAYFGKSQNGWMTTELFYGWLVKQFKSLHSKFHLDTLWSFWWMAIPHISTWRFHAFARRMQFSCTACHHIHLRSLSHWMLGSMARWNSHGRRLLQNSVLKMSGSQLLRKHLHMFLWGIWQLCQSWNNHECFLQCWDIPSQLCSYSPKQIYAYNPIRESSHVMMKAMISKGMNFTQFGQNSSMQLSLCDESETKNDDDDKHKDHKVRDTKATGKSTEQACNVSNPTHLVTGSSALDKILTCSKPDQQKKTRGGYNLTANHPLHGREETSKEERGRRA